MRLGHLIDAFRPAEGPPPRTLLAFFRWSLSGAWPVLIWATFASSAAGLMQVFAAVLLGRIVDSSSVTLLAAGPGAVLAQNWPLYLLFAGFYLVGMPLIFGLSSATNAIAIGPNVMPLVLSRLHRWTMGH